MTSRTTTAEFLFINREKFPMTYNAMYLNLKRNERICTVQKDRYNTSYYTGDYPLSNVTCSGSGITKSPHPFSSIK
jgi:hypothetical protein